MTTGGIPVFTYLVTLTDKSILLQSSYDEETYDERKNIMKKLTVAAFLLAGLLTTSIAFAGYYHHGHGCMMPSWDMNAMDADGDGSLTFDEYSESYKESLRGGFDMIDENNDGEIGVDEWQNFLEIHGMSTKS